MKIWYCAGLAAGLAAVLLYPALPGRTQRPVSTDALHQRLAEARSRKDFSREELKAMLATTPPGPYYCPTGEIWPAFESGAPHSPSTVRLLRSLYEEEKQEWRRYHLLNALSRQKDPSLRTFWLQLMRGKAGRRQFLHVVSDAIVAVGTDEDMRELVRKMETSEEWRYPVLSALFQRPLPEALAPTAAIFQNAELRYMTRRLALRLMVKLDPANTEKYLHEAMQGGAELRAEAEKIRSGLKQNRG